MLDPGASRPLPDDSLGFPATLVEIATEAARRDPYEASSWILTFGGRVPLEIGERALTTPQAALRRALSDPRSLAREDGPECELGLRPDGRILLAERGSEAAGVETVGPRSSFRLSPFGTEAHARALAEARRRAEADEEEVRGWLATASPDEVREILGRLQHTGMHTPPIVLYVEDEVYSNFRFENNLSGKVLLPTSEHCVYRQLSTRDPSSWSVEDATLVYCANLAQVAGGPLALEAFNSTQLVPRELHAHFERRSRAYLGLGTLECGALSPDASAVATRLGRARKDAMERYQPYRRIWGINLNKQEEYLPRAAVSEAAAAVLDRLHASPLVPPDVPDEPAFAAFVDEWVPGVVAGDEPPRSERFANAVEELIHELVLATIELTDAEIGMSRGFRSLLDLADATEREAWDEAVAWEQPSYYCCCVASEELRARHADDPAALADVLWAIAARMEYNAWHFLGGNLPRTGNVEERDYFYPPVQPDLAEWSDQHHRGHVTSGVRNSIRAPSDVEVGGKLFKAFTDVRVLRREGAPFEPEDLAVAVAASRLVASLLGALARETRRRGVDLRIESFGPSWYAAGAAPEASVA